MQPSVPIDSAWQARLEQTYPLDSAVPWTEAQSASPLPTPLLGEDAEPDPAFFVESWTAGVTTASENYLRRHQHEKSHETPPPSAFPSFTFVTFLNFEPPAPVASANSYSPAEPLRDFSAAMRWDEEEAFTPSPLTFPTACRLLGVAANSTQEQIKTAYRKMASRYHPDRLESAGSVDPQLATDRMASINEAYRLLCAVAIERPA